MKTISFNTLVVKIKKRLLSYWYRLYYYSHGLYFDYVLKQYKSNGVSITVPKALTRRITRGYFAEGNIEKDEQELVLKHIMPEATVLELGANLGVVSNVINKKLAKPDNQVVLEANPTVIPYLELNKKNNKSSFRIENKILSNQKETPFYFGHSISSGGIIDKNSNGSDNSVIVKGITFDQLQKKHNLKFDTLVMDIEGAEYELFKEIDDFLHQFNLILFEEHPKILSQEQMDEINRVLEKNDFK